MYRKIMFSAGSFLLGYGLWVSPDFKEIAAGIAIFLFGMLSLEQGFRSFTGGVLEKILRTITDKLWKRLSFGIFSTVLMQSSSLVSVLTISFLSAGLLDLAAGMGIVFGANLGTTTGAWLVAGYGVKVNISAYAMPMLVFGVLLVLQKPAQVKGVGYILSGVGFLFLGIHYMKDGFEAFRNTISLTEYALPGLKGLVVYVLLGIAATVIIQSSDATMVLIITALSVQQVTYENAVAMAIGANIGTTITALIGSISANIEGKRLAAAHLLFNTITAVIALLLLNRFVWLVDIFSTAVGINSDDYPLKLAAFHSLFNLVGISLMLPFVNVLARLLQKLLKAKVITVDQPRYLNQAALVYPDTVVEAVNKETIHLYQNAVKIMLNTLALTEKDLTADSGLQEIISKRQIVPFYDFDTDYEKYIKGIYSAIIAFIVQADVSKERELSKRLYWLRLANRHIVEALKGSKHMQKNLRRISSSRHQAAIVEYNKIRYQLALLIREIESIRKRDVIEELPLLTLDNLKASIEEQDQQMNQTIDALIREHKISAETGTSLINDSAYLYNIKQHLLKMAETVFIINQPTVTDAEKQLALNRSELLEVINPKAKEASPSS